VNTVVYAGEALESAGSIETMTSRADRVREGEIVHDFKPINVLQFICPAGFFGAEMWILALAKHLDPKKVNCRLAVTHESAGQNLELYRRFKELGLQADKIGMKGRFDIRGLYGLVNLLKKDRIDIINTHGYKSDIMGLLAAWMTGIKTVATPHGFENAKDFKLQAFIKLGCIALRYFDSVTPVSEELMADMNRIGLTGHKNRLIRNGVDLQEVYSEKSRVSEPVSCSNYEKKIGYVGQIAYRKNLDAMIDAFDLLYRDHKNVRLLLIGDGKMRNELQSKASKLACADRIEFLGFRNDRLRFVKELDLFCMTSSLEGIPRCMMEAMAMGVPVVAFDIPGVDKLIIHETTGLMAPYGDIAALKKCWERILFNGDLAEKLAENGKKHIEDNFSAKRMAEEYTALYQEMIMNRS
jgi:glycosyltransferase involved in cell wall biosynthesis